MGRLRPAQPRYPPVSTLPGGFSKSTRGTARSLAGSAKAAKAPGTPGPSFKIRREGLDSGRSTWPFWQTSEVEVRTGDGGTEASVVVVEEAETGAHRGEADKGEEEMAIREGGEPRKSDKGTPTDAEIGGARWPNWEGETYYRPSRYDARTILCSCSVSRR